MIRYANKLLLHPSLATVKLPKVQESNRVYIEYVSYASVRIGKAKTGGKKSDRNVSAKPWQMQLKAVRAWLHAPKLKHSWLESNLSWREDVEPFQCQRKILSVKPCYLAKKKCCDIKYRSYERWAAAHRPFSGIQSSKVLPS